MENDIKESEDKKRTDQEKENFESSSIINQPQEETKVPDNSQNPPNNQKKSMLKFWREYDIPNKIQVSLAIINFFTLLAFIVIGWVQSCYSRKSIDYADSTNVHTRESIVKSDFSNKKIIKNSEAQFRYQRNKDSIRDFKDSLRAIKQDRKDDLFVKSQNERDGFARESFVMENRAYVVIDSIIFPKEFNFNGGGTKITFRIKNVGKTPSQYTQLFTWSSDNKNVIEQLFIERYKEVMKNKIGGFVIGNNDFLKLPDTLFKGFTVVDYIHLSKGNLIYIGGIIGYYDIFKIHRVTYYCFQYSYLKHEIAPYKGYNNIDYYEKTKNNN